MLKPLDLYGDLVKNLSASIVSKSRCCPECKSRQLQLINSFDRVAYWNWRCRICNKLTHHDMLIAIVES